MITTINPKTYKTSSFFLHLSYRAPSLLKVIILYCQVQFLTPKISIDLKQLLKNSCEVNFWANTTKVNQWIPRTWKRVRDSEIGNYASRRPISNIFSFVPKFRCEISSREQSRGYISMRWQKNSPVDFSYWEFDPGSGWTLAAWIRHASRTELFAFKMRLHQVKKFWSLVADGVVTRRNSPQRRA